MKTIIIDNILTPYEVARYNEINKVLKNNLEVWFINKKETNRNWKEFPTIKFQYLILNKAIKLFELRDLLELERNRIERVVCSGWDSPVYYYALLFCKKNKIRFTLWSGSTQYEISWRRKLFSPLVNWIIRNSTDYIAHGTRAKEYLISLGADQKKIKIFLNSVDVDFFMKSAAKVKKIRSSLRIKHNISSTDFLFLYVGQLIDRKGIKELVRAFIKYTEIKDNIKLLIVGDGPLKRDLQNIVISYNCKNIIFTGFIQYQKLPEIYAISDALILPSKEEVWGLVVNEALASGIPAVVSHFAGCSVDLITKDTGMTMQKITREDIIRTLDRFLQKKYLVPETIIDKMRNAKYAYENFKQ